MFYRPLHTLVLLSVFGYVLTVPLSPPQTQAELLKDISEFLRDNEEVAEALRNVDMDHFMSRTRRDAIDDSMMDVELGKEPQQKEEGFFDRAAKFVMEVLQRFLKWINTDN
ncbi:uncharacterized protein LOC123315284 [Coccinella septempunctata]|uniref:uncharacterized protein LOC123315284 n=1 Tax=Coccinella septempunctata TaxID=41139 RepID=UPI001D099A9B|nr:uncharacterized protein LOC123315284 [Coccinella septempunctata]